MDILALHLSPRKNGNSEIMLDEFIRGAEEAGAAVEKFSVADHRIEPCAGCAVCEETGECVITGDDMGPLYPKLASAPMVVVSTSLFFYDVPAAGKALIDRTQPLWASRYVFRKSDTLRPDGKGFLLALGATRGKDLFLPVNLCVKYFFDSIGMPKEFDSLCYRQIEKLGDMKNSPEHLAEVYAAGKAFGLQKPKA
ncbi:flavodoxin family protein [Deltaproteobacteria bacterium OttesenSCG-928-M10]|nr:flavodoxin family protein [Deltaproteobacteria bacterium OttesenSCG-928-M10]